MPVGQTTLNTVYSLMFTVRDVSASVKRDTLAVSAGSGSTSLCKAETKACLCSTAPRLQLRLLLLLLLTVSHRAFSRSQQVQLYRPIPLLFSSSPVLTVIDFISTDTHRETSSSTTSFTDPKTYIYR